MLESRIYSVLLWSFLPFAFYSPFLEAQSAHKKPYELFTSNQIQELERRLDTSTNNADEIASQARAMLDSYYKQFVADKRIASQRHYPLFDPLNMSSNVTRLVADARTRKNIAPYFLGDSSFLQRIYVVMGGAFAKKKDGARALWSYSMALRYSHREIRSRANPTKLEIQKRFLLMSKSWASAERLEEESDLLKQNTILRFNQELPLYQKSIMDCEKFKKDVYAKEADLFRGRADARVVEITKKKRDQACRDEKKYFQSLNEIRKENYTTYINNKNKFESKIAYKMALLVKSMEEKNTIQLRKNNEGNFLRSIGDIRRKNKTRLISHTGYTQLLELAHFLDSFEPRYLELLAIQEQRAGNVKEALSWQLQHIELSKQKNKNIDEYKDQYLRLSQLYESNREYVQSADALEEYFKIETDTQKKSKQNLRLALLHYKYTGRYSRALLLFQKEAKRLEGLLTTKLNEHTVEKINVSRHGIYEKLAIIYKKRRQPRKQEAQLMNAVSVYKDMFFSREKLRKQKSQLNNQIIAIKKQILQRENENLRERYYKLLKVDTPALQFRIDTLTRRNRQLKHAHILSRVVRVAWQKKEFRRVQTLLRKIMIIGDSRQATLARRNLDLVEKIMTDGIVRPLHRR